MVEITAEHWLPASTIKENYLSARRRLTGEDARRPKPRSLAVLEFVEDETRQEGKRPTWAELLRRWNARFPDRRFGDDSNLRKTYAAAVETLCNPTVRVLWPRPTAASERRKRRMEQRGDEAIRNVTELLQESTRRRREGRR